MRVRVLVDVPAGVDPARVVAGMSAMGWGNPQGLDAGGRVMTWLVRNPAVVTCAAWVDVAGLAGGWVPDVAAPRCRNCGDAGDCGGDLCAVCAGDLARGGLLAPGEPDPRG